MSDQLSQEWDDILGIPKMSWRSDSPPDELPDYAVHMVVEADETRPLARRMLYKPASRETLVVSMHGALNRAKYTTPRFEWQRTLSRLDCDQLYLSDSTLELNRSIEIGWYIGTAQQDLLADYAELVLSIVLAGSYKRVVCVGSSAGGFGALALSKRLPGSVAVVFSPQTSLGGYAHSHRAALSAASFPGYATFDSIEEDFGERVNMRKLYKASENRNYVHYVQNTRDRFHFEAHYAPFALSLGVDPESGGFAVGRAMSFHPERQEPGHAPPSRGSFLKHIETAHKQYYGVSLGRLQPDETDEKLLGYL